MKKVCQIRDILLIAAGLLLLVFASTELKASPELELQLIQMWPQLNTEQRDRARILYDKMIEKDINYQKSTLPSVGEYDTVFKIEQRGRVIVSHSELHFIPTDQAIAKGNAQIIGNLCSYITTKFSIQEMGYKYILVVYDQGNRTTPRNALMVDQSVCDRIQSF